eukprot:63008-Hanusia_phi.AAC.1
MKYPGIVDPGVTNIYMKGLYPLRTCFDLVSDLVRPTNSPRHKTRLMFYQAPPLPILPNYPPPFMSRPAQRRPFGGGQAHRPITWVPGLRDRGFQTVERDRGTPAVRVATTVIHDPNGWVNLITGPPGRCQAPSPWLSVTQGQPVPGPPRRPTGYGTVRSG